MVDSAPGRNDPCPCGSGQKYKKCCMGKDVPLPKSPVLAPDLHEDYINRDTEVKYGEPFLDESFFKVNLLREMSPQRLLYSVLMRPDAELLAAKYKMVLSPRGKKQAEAIEGASGVQDLLEVLKDRPEPLNHNLLTRKLLEHNEEAASGILDGFQGPPNDTFIELGLRILHVTGVNCADRLIELINNGLGNAYWNSMMCVLLSIQEHPDAPQVLWDQFHILKDQFPEDTYSDGPLLGLNEIRIRKNQKT